MSGFLGELSQVGRTVSGITSTAGALGRLGGDVSGLFGAAAGGYGATTLPEAGAWLAQLRPASWRGLGFGVNSSEYARGRRVAVHEYPFRDEVWVEDLGRGIRSVAFSGFVVGDDCYAQAKALLAAGETAGAGELVHPSLGSVTVALVAPMRMSERKELGRVVELSFEFIETGLSIYPAASVSTGDVATLAASTADAGSTGDFLSSVGSALSEGAQVVSAGVRTAQAWASRITTLAGDASLVTGAVAGLTGNLGRFSSGARGTLLTGVQTVEGAIGAVNGARAGVAQASSSLVSLASGL